MFAAVIASTLTRLTVGAGPLYGAQPFHLASQAELPLIFLVGMLAGVVGVVFMRVLRFAEFAFHKLKVSRPVRAGAGGLIVGLIACGLPEVTGNGYEPIREMLTSDVSIAFVATFLVAKIIATSASVGSGSPGGVFTPSLALGAALGILVSQLFSQLIPAAHLSASGGYALVGMAGMVAATTHAPLMAAVLVFELSGDYVIILPLLVSCVAATAVARWLEPRSIYMQELSRSGVAWELTIDGRTVIRDE
jgi:CIC family chloride channel protein